MTSSSHPLCTPSVIHHIPEILLGLNVMTFEGRW